MSVKKIDSTFAQPSITSKPTVSKFGNGNSFGKPSSILKKPDFDSPEKFPINKSLFDSHYSGGSLFDSPAKSNLFGKPLKFLFDPLPDNKSGLTKAYSQSPSQLLSKKILPFGVSPLNNQTPSSNSLFKSSPFNSTFGNPLFNSQMPSLKPYDMKDYKVKPDNFKLNTLKDVNKIKTFETPGLGDLDSKADLNGITKELKLKDYDDLTEFARKPDEVLKEKYGYDAGRMLKFKLEHKLKGFGSDQKKNLQFDFDKNGLFLHDGEKKFKVKADKDGNFVTGKADDKITFGLKKNKLAIGLGDEKLTVKLDRKQIGILRNASFGYAEPTRQIDDPVTGRNFKFGRLRVEGPFNAPGTNPASPERASPAARDAGHNGNAYRIVGENINTKANPVIFVNGINTDLAGARRTAAEISQMTGAPVDLAYNSSSPVTAGGRTSAHFWNLSRTEAEAAVPREGIFSNASVRNARVNVLAARIYAGHTADPNTADWAKRNSLHNPPTAQTTANLILDQLKTGSGSVNVVAYSQGGAITTDALRRLESQGVDLSRVRVLTVGAAADRDDFPSSVHVSSLAHRTDFISQFFGENRANLNINAVGSQALDGGRLTQHTNYFAGQGGGNPGDPNAERLLRHWHNGNSFDFQLLNDVEQEKKK
jgi:hypothetical protein